VSAVDGRRLALPETSLFHANIIAVNLSHERAIEEFLSSGANYCAIFEDDAVPTRRSPANLLPLLEELVVRMQDHNIDLLQIGHISSIYSFANRQGLTYPLLQFVLGSRRVRVKVLSQFLTIHKNQFRSGTHAYILSRETALALRGTNNPPVFVIDDFLEYVALANINQTKARLNFATLNRSLFEQESSLTSKAKDSDSKEI
jgi:GR25 family glycosyltransferase involved in LPS biosynthesis